MEILYKLLKVYLHLRGNKIQEKDFRMRRVKMGFHGEYTTIYGKELIKCMHFKYYHKIFNKKNFFLSQNLDYVSSIT